MTGGSGVVAAGTGSALIAVVWFSTAWLVAAMGVVVAATETVEDGPTVVGSIPRSDPPQAKVIAPSKLARTSCGPGRRDMVDAPRSFWRGRWCHRPTREGNRPVAGGEVIARLERCPAGELLFA